MKKAKYILLIAFVGVASIQLMAQSQKLLITVDDKEFTATLNNNETVNSFKSLLPLEINMTEMGGYEKYYYLPQNLPGSASNVGTTYEGDLMIWSSNCLVLFYTTRSTSYSYIRLGRIDDTTGLREALGSGSVRVKYELEGQTTAIEKVEVKEDLYKVSPLPATDYFEVSGEFKRLSLYNVSGGLVAESKESIVYTNSLPSGVYFLRIDSGKNGIHTKKIVKK